MDKQTIDLEDLYSELQNPPTENDKDFNTWYDKSLKKHTEIKKTKNGFKILIIALSGLLFIISLLPNLTELWVRIIQFLSFSLMVSIWIFIKHVTLNPDKNLSIMRFLNKGMNNSKS